MCLCKSRGTPNTISEFGLGLGLDLDPDPDLMPRLKTLKQNHEAKMSFFSHILAITLLCSQTGLPVKILTMSFLVIMNNSALELQCQECLANLYHQP